MCADFSDIRFLLFELLFLLLLLGGFSFHHLLHLALGLLVSFRHHAQRRTHRWQAFALQRSSILRVGEIRLLHGRLRLSHAELSVGRFQLLGRTANVAQLEATILVLIEQNASALIVQLSSQLCAFEAVNLRAKKQMKRK